MLDSIKQIAFLIKIAFLASKRRNFAIFYAML